MQGVTLNPNVHHTDDIGHWFTDRTLRELKIGGGGFLLPTEEDRFRRMLGRYGKVFTFLSEEIRCVDSTIVEPMVIFTVPHVPWNLKPIPVPRAHIPKLMELLKQKVEMGILEPSSASSAPYSNRWFNVPKKNDMLHFIRDMHPVNKVTIRNTGI